MKNIKKSNSKSLEETTLKSMIFVTRIKGIIFFTCLVVILTLWAIGTKTLLDKVNDFIVKQYNVQVYHGK